MIFNFWCLLDLVYTVNEDDEFSVIIDNDIDIDDDDDDDELKTKIGFHKQQ